MKVFNIETTKKDFFYKYMLVLSGIVHVRPVAMRVFADFLYWNDKFKDIDRDKRNLLLFNKETRSKILQGIDISRASLDNQLTYLRKNSLLLGNTINPKYEIFYETHKDLMFSFKLKEEEDD